MNLMSIWTSSPAWLGTLATSWISFTAVCFTFCTCLREWLLQHLLELRPSHMLLDVTYSYGYAAALNFPSMTIFILTSTAVYCVIQRVLHYRTSRQPRHLSGLHDSQP
jgi:hypothetical protein